MSLLLIIGAGGHGKVVADVALETGEWDEVVFLDDDWPNKKKNGCWDVLGTAQDFIAWKDRCTSAVVAIGNNRVRFELQAKLITAGFNLATIVHPSAHVSRYAKLGVGSVIFAQAVINVDAVVGDAAIINTAATIDHDCILGSAVHVAPGGSIGGGVMVGDFSWIGIGASVKHYITLGQNVTVGAGAAVVCNIGNNMTVVGVPARQLIK